MISKPYRKDDLARKLRQALSRAASNGAPAVLQRSLMAGDFSVTIRDEEETMEAEREQAMDKNETSVVQGRTVLVVEDEFLIRMATVDMLDELGHQVHEAGSANEALEILRSGATADVLLTDLNLPGMSGLQLAHEARKLRPSIAIVVATGYAVRGDVAGAGYPQDTLILAKPFQIGQLRDALRNAV